MKLRVFWQLLGRRDNDQKSAPRRLLECALLYIRSRLGPGFYYLAALDKRDAPLSDVLGFASVRAYNRAVHRANDASYHRSSQHKAIEKAVLTCFSIPTPGLLAFAHRERGRAVNGASANTAGSLVSLMASREPGSRYCLKQANGWGGEGFRVIELARDGGQLLDVGTNTSHESKAYFEQMLVSSPEGFVIEEYLEQHTFYSALNRSSVNSFRIVIWDRPGAERPWLLAFLRVGRDGALVDNATSGAIILPVDPATGRLGPGFEKYGERVRYAVHPESGQQLEGVLPPDFDKAVEVALSAVRAFPGIRFAGVDVAMGVDGPAILELNVWPDYAGFAYCRVPSVAAFTSTV